MTITTEAELAKLKAIGRICAVARDAMAAALTPGITTQELDDIGRRILDAAGARSAPEITYDFPGATCISVNEEIAHGIPGDRVLARGDLVNIDVSASKDGFFADTGATFRLGMVRPSLDRLCRDGRRATEIGIAQVGAGRPLAGIGNAVGRFARARGYTLIRNLASHGIGRALHEAPKTVPTWPTSGDRRQIHRGLVLTVEPFLSQGGLWAREGGDDWTLYAEPPAPVVQYEHTVVATAGRAIVVTLPV